VKGNYRRLVEAIDKGRFVPIGPGTSRRTLIFEDDLASAISCAVAHDLAAGRTFNVSDGRFHEVREILAEIAGALDRPLPRWRVPLAAARVAAAAVGMIDRRVPLMLEKYVEDTAVDASRIQREINFTPAFDLRRGWSATIQRMREQRLGILGAKAPI
jgi:nucleoside-diphosphate-sugar epimerase